MENSFAIDGDKMFLEGRYNDAIDYYLLFLGTLSYGSVEYGETLCNIAKAHSQKGRYQKAKDIFKQSLDFLVKHYNNDHSVIDAVEKQIEYCDSCLSRGGASTVKSETLEKTFKRFYETVDKKYMLKVWCLGIIKALHSCYRDFEVMPYSEQQDLFKLVDDALKTDLQHVTVLNAQSFAPIFNKVAYEAAKVVRSADYIEPPIPIIRNGRR